MTSVELIKELVAKWRLILFAALLGGSSTYLYYKLNPSEYISTVSFYVESPSQQGNQDIKISEKDVVFVRSIDAERIYNMVESSQMIKHLIEKFNLYEHYGINVKKDFYYEKAFGILTSRIKVNQTFHNAIEVIVQDKDKLMAADLANEIFAYLNVINREIIVANIEKKVRIYEKVISNLKTQTESEVNKLLVVVEKCKELQDKKFYTLNDKDMIFDLRFKMAQLANEITNSSVDISRSLKIYGVSVEDMQKENIPSLIIINTALPEIKSNRRQVFLYTFGVAFFSAWAAIGMVLVWYRYKLEIKKSLHIDRSSSDL